LIKLTRSFRKIEQGNLKTIDSTSRISEIQVLEQGYNSMVVTIDELMESMVDARTENVQAKFLALQSQINPHFLSNSLDTIRSMAIQGNNYKIEGIVDSIAKIFRYILADSTTLVTLREELEYVKHYFRIQEYRFGKTVQIVFNIQKETLDCQMP